MSNMDHPQHIAITEHLTRIRIVLVETSLAANIGSAARAMKTMGLSQLVLVNPRTFPCQTANANAAGAVDILEHARIVSSLDEAIDDCHLTIATSARLRHLNWPMLSPQSAAEHLLTLPTSQTIALVFGRENHGLSNAELSLAQYHLQIPTWGNYGVLNIAAAVQVIGYSLLNTALQQHALLPLPDTVNHPPTMQQLSQLHHQVKTVLTDMELLDPKQPRELPMRLRRLFGRMALDQIEYNLLRDVFGRMHKLINPAHANESPTYRHNSRES